MKPIINRTKNRKASIRRNKAIAAVVTIVSFVAFMVEANFVFAVAFFAGLTWFTISRFRE